MKFNIQIVSFYLILALILLTSFSMFVERYIPNFEKLVLVFSFSVSVFVLAYSISKARKFKKEYLFIIIPFIVATFLYSIFIGKVASYLVEFLIISSSLLPLLLLRELEERKLMVVAKIIFVLGFIQLFFDLLLPNPEYSDLDKFTGTFNSGNDKARFLIFVLLSFFFLGKKFIKIKPFGFLFRLAYAGPIIISIFLGFSLFAYLTFFVSVVSAFIFKRLSVFLIGSSIVFMIGTYIVYNIDYDKKSPSSITYNYHRYFDFDHGVAAVYIYGSEILRENNCIFGVGFGNWVSRSGQLFKSDFLEDNPSTMITYGTLYTESFAPPGLSAFYIQTVEFGLICIPVILLFLHILFTHKSRSRYGLISFYFLFFFINYSPLFFEYQSLSFLFILSYFVFNKLIK